MSSPVVLANARRYLTRAGTPSRCSPTSSLGTPCDVGEVGDKLGPESNGEVTAEDLHSRALVYRLLPGWLADTSTAS